MTGRKSGIRLKRKNLQKEEERDVKLPPARGHPEKPLPNEQKPDNHSPGPENQAFGRLHKSPMSKGLERQAPIRRGGSKNQERKSGLGGSMTCT